MICIYILILSFAFVNNFLVGFSLIASNKMFQKYLLITGGQNRHKFIRNEDTLWV